MPIPKPINPRLIARLRSMAQKERQKDPSMERLYRQFSRLKNVDHRFDPTESRTHIHNLVRALHVSRSHPEKEIVIKRVHGAANAQETLQRIKQAAVDFNSQYPQAPIKLIDPPYEVIAEDLIAMPKLDYPNFWEVDGREATKRGNAMRTQLEQQGFPVDKIMGYGFFLRQKTGIGENQHMILGLEGKKLLVMAFADLR